MWDRRSGIPRLYVDTNITGTLNLLEGARLGGVEQFIFASSSSVYGLAPSMPFREDMPLLQTISPYAATKLAGEQFCANYAHLYGIRAVCLRFFNAYGPRLRPDLAIHQFTSPHPSRAGDRRVRRRFACGGISPTSTTRCRACWRRWIMRGPIFDIFNLGESATTSVTELIELIEQALGKKAKINRLPERPGDVPRTYADISKARRLLHYKPATPISQGIPRFVDWYLSTQDEGANSRRPRQAVVEAGVAS